ncbi:DUF1499 domain-containing protein [Neptuniibacter sp.]|uniref:DUF1499 domain-containing protein n=1 Tax=Neptuniibacter sp. TaxID=1962643 RepID=UPI002636238F|nr:DUF1499 domain-containing protein [Neptuniibacter sp.]
MLISIVVLIIAFLAVFFFKAYQSKTGNAAGLDDGKLTICSDKPNCVCSEYPDHSSHYIQPIKLPIEIETEEQFAAYARDLVTQAGGEVTLQENSYLAASFTSSFFGFVDDLELRLDLESRVIQIRSASRAGYSDLGVNAKRVEHVRSLVHG